MDKVLLNIFDPSHFTVLDDTKMSKEEVISRAEFEKKAFAEITSNLKKNMRKIGLHVTYASEIIICELALNILIVSRIKHFLIDGSVTELRGKVKPICTKEDSFKRKVTDYEEVCHQSEINSIFTDLLPILEKMINTQLRLLCLLPEQQVQREKLTIVKKLRQRLLAVESKDQQYSVEAIFEGKDKVC